VGAARPPPHPAFRQWLLWLLLLFELLELLELFDDFRVLTEKIFGNPRSVI
jgi:hypothetical protein